MINSPEWQLSFNADLDQPINDRLNLVGNVVAAYTSKTLWQASAIPGVPARLRSATGYWLVNARLGVQVADDKWELAVYAKNLFNTGLFDLRQLGGSLWQYPAVGRSADRRR